MITASYTFPTLTVNCVGSDRAMRDLDMYFNMHKERVCLDIFAKRIISQHVYCFMIGQTALAKIDARQYNKQFKMNGLLMTADEFDEAIFLTHPDEIAKLFGISDEMKKSLLQAASVWNKRKL
jgi:hypothetical protein